MFIGFYCKKTSSDLNDPGKLEILRGTSSANKKNSIQAVYTSKDNSLIGYYYGSFDVNGSPDSISQMVIKKTQGDTSIQILFDSVMRVKTIYSSVNGVKLNSMLTFDYSVINKTIVNSFYYNFNTDSSKLLYQYTYDNSIKSITNTTSYASFGSGLMNILLQIPTNNTPDPFLSQIFVASGGYTGAAVVLSAGIGIGVGILTGNPLFGIAAASLTAYILLSPSKANASEISSTTGNPQTPFVSQYPTIYIISPSNKTGFNIYPRTTNIVWNKVPTATTYFFEAEIGRGPNFHDYNTSYGTHSSQTLSTNSTILYGGGAQVHRFRVTAKKGINIITQTPWQYIDYLQ